MMWVMGISRSRRPDADGILTAQIAGTGLRLARAGGSIADAVAELDQLAAGRTDLLLHSAGISIGAWYGDTVRSADQLIAGALPLWAAGRIDYAELSRLINLGRERASTTYNTDRSVQGERPDRRT